ncbi:MAG: hypothetical protein FIA92_05285 [Chloroflexi bacterium]|nr:hypothetical protein [Chloroflexota bacterium]
MRRSMVLVAVAIVLVAVSAPAAAGSGSTWHRNNYGSGHERFHCADGNVWQCTYDNVREPDMTWNPKSMGLFNGTAQDAAWCPGWARAVCDHATTIVVGATTYGLNEPGAFTWWEEVIFTDGDGVAPMYRYYIGPQFEAMCPWYATWSDALANDFECIWPS